MPRFPFAPSALRAPAHIALASLAAATMLQAEVVATFSGGNSQSESDAYPGKEGGGWVTPWQTKALNAQGLDLQVSQDGQLGEKTALSIKGVTQAESSEAAAGFAVVRSYGERGSDIDLQDTLHYEFSIRLDAVSRESRYVVFDANKAQPNSGANATWQISAQGGFWRVVDGAGNGGQQTEINTGIPALADAVYSFSVTANPATRTWSVTIKGDKQTATLDKLNFRSSESRLGGNIHFGFSDAAPDTPTDFQYAITGIRISR